MRRLSIHHRIDLNPFLAILLVMSMIAFPLLSGVHIYQNAQGQSQGEESSPDDDTLQVINSDVRGAYEDDSGTVRIVFPDGWSGLEVSEENGSIIIVSASPDGIVTLEDLTDADPVLNLVVAKKGSVDMAPGTIPPLLSEIGGVTSDCRVTSSKFFLLNGVFSEELLSECVITNSAANGNENGSADDSKRVTLNSVLTHTRGTWVALIFHGTPEVIGSAATQFKSALNTLQVLGAVDMSIPFGFVTFKTVNVNANGSKIPVDIKSNTNITAFALDESNKVVSFRAEGVTREGIAEVSIGRVLEGPYVVTVNGQVWDDFDIFNAENPRQDKIQIRYEQEGSQIMIRGTQVVPEFGFGSILGATGAFSSTVILAGGVASLIIMAKLITNRGTRRNSGNTI